MTKSRKMPNRKVQPVAQIDETRAWRSEQGTAHRVFSEKVNRITRAKEQGQRTQPLVRDFLRNPLVRLSAALRATGCASDRETTYALRARVDPWNTELPKVLWYPKVKADGTTRPICNLPPELKAVHIMLSAAIAAQMPPVSGQHGTSGLNRDDAARALKDFQNSGFTFLAKVDIVDCFQSINPNALYELPLPKEVIHRTLDTRNIVFTCRAYEGVFSSLYSRHPYEQHNSSGPRGLMQGSPASSIMLAWLLNSLPKSEHVATFLCFDNIAVASKDRAGSREMVKTLTDYLIRCSAGPLALCDPIYADNASMEFLSYEFDPSRTDIGVSERALGGLEARLGPAEEQDMAERAEFPLRVWRELQSFRDGFPAVENPEFEFEYYILTSEDIAEAADWNQIAYHLHRHLFAPRDSVEWHFIRYLLSDEKASKTPTRR